jgi:hypothetical protein
MIRDLIHFKPRNIIYEGTFKDIFPYDEKIIELTPAIIDPERSLCLNENFVPTDTSFAEYIYNFNGNIAHWITNQKLPSNDLKTGKEFFLKNVESRKMSAFEYVQSLTYKPKIEFPDEFLYVNLLYAHKSYNFGHFLDYLLKLKNFPEKYLNQKICYIISNHNRIKEFDKWLRFMSPVKDFKTLEIYDFADYQDKLLVFPRLLEIKKHIWYGNFSDKTDYDFIKNSFKKNIQFVESQENKKLFLTRIPPQERHIKNYKELHKKLTDRGIKILYGDESLEEKYNLMNNSTHICGYHGSMFINAFLFASPNTCILEYCPETRYNCNMPVRSFGTDYHFFKTYPSDKNHNADLPIDEILSFYETDKDELNNSVKIIK